MTLGEIIGIVRKSDILYPTALEELEEILDKRNDLVHKYFKRLDFEKQADNVPFLENSLRYLKNFHKKVNDFNDWLVSLG